ncbi:MAG: RNA methyltransferase [Alphaproteobacteria bacterium]|nr:RNA methyltransferase [Alphaproteobacteria bacterium]
MASEIKPPVIILVKPQLGENIGTAARAMYNGGLASMRLVAPRSGWPDPSALKPSAGAYDIIMDAKVFETTREAISDLHLVYATTARMRDMNKPTFTPKQAVEALHDAIAKDVRVGILFGPERTGLENDDLSLVNGLIHIPLNPDFTSLNLAQAVLIMAYEWFQTLNIEGNRKPLRSQPPLASKSELLDFFDQLESELDRTGFLRVLHKRPVMVRNIRNIFQRLSLTSQEVKTLRGVIGSFARPYLKD